MESYGLDMEDIFDTEADLDDDLAVPPSMPDLEEDEAAHRNPEENQDGEGEDGDGPDADILSKLKDLSKGAAKKKVMKPQPKLDLERLKSKRGLHALPKVFQDAKFKGKGHEAEDLRLMMGRLEHWAHRLFPKLPFDDFIERLEKLGSKKPVMNCVKRIRLGLDDEENEDVTRAEEEAADDVDRGVTEGAAAAEPEFTDLDAEEAYEAMMQEEREQAEKRNKTSGKPSSSTTMPHQSSQANGGGDFTSPKRTPHKASESPSSRQTDKVGGMTEEQKARMERNRQLALERRLAKLGKSPAPGSKTSVGSSSQNTSMSQSTPLKSQEQGDAASPTLKLKPKVKPTEDEATAEELEAMLASDEEMSKGMTEPHSENLDLQLSATTRSSQSENSSSQEQQENAQRSEITNSNNNSNNSSSNNSSSCNSSSRASCANMDSGEAKQETGDLNLQMTATESEPNDDDNDLNLQLAVTETEEKNTEEQEKDGGDLDLHLPATEFIEPTEPMSKSTTESLKLRLSESEMPIEDNIGKCDDSDNNNSRKESDSDNMDLRLNVSISEEEPDL